MTKRCNNKPGDTYNWWTLIAYDHKEPRQGEFWLMECKCGARHVKRLNAIKRGQGKSCHECYLKRRRRKPTGPNKKPDNGDTVTLQWAVCPKCGRKHRVWIFFNGRGKIRKYCKECAVLAQKSELVYSLPPLWGGGRSAAI